MQVNHQVIKKEDRYILSRVVDLMVALELRFVQEQQGDGQMTYRLDPCVKYCMRSGITDVIFQSYRRLYHLRRQASNGHCRISLCNSMPGSWRGKDTKQPFRHMDANIPSVD